MNTILCSPTLLLPTTNSQVPIPSFLILPLHSIRTLHLPLTHILDSILQVINICRLLNLGMYLQHLKNQAK